MASIAAVPAHPAPVVPGAPVVKQTQRPHPATPLIRGWLVLVAIIFTFGRQLLPDGDEEGFSTDDLGWILLGVAGIVVLAASADSSGPGPLVTRLMREVATLPCPITIVPGDISRERLEKIT